MSSEDWVPVLRTIKGKVCPICGHAFPTNEYEKHFSKCSKKRKEYK